jgi:hypothetical protein
MPARAVGVERAALAASRSLCDPYRWTLPREVAVSAATRFGRRVVFVLLCASFATAFADVINFENLPDTYFFSAGDQNIGSFYPGVTFGPDVTALSVSRFGGYDNLGFPPHSGDVVIWDATDPTITISLASPIVSFGIWYTTFDPLTLQAFDASDNLLGSVIGNPNTDGATGVSSFLAFSSPGIQTVHLTSSPGLFVLGDVTTPVPEPGALLLLLAGVGALVLAKELGGKSSRRIKKLSPH